MGYFFFLMIIIGVFSVKVFYFFFRYCKVCCVYFFIWVKGDELCGEVNGIFVGFVFNFILLCFLMYLFVVKSDC